MPEGIDPEKKPSEGVPLDGPAFSPDRLTVRGRDLNDLVGSLRYPAALYHLLTGELPSRRQAQTLDRWLLETMPWLPAHSGIIGILGVSRFRRRYGSADRRSPCWRDGTGNRYRSDRGNARVGNGIGPRGRPGKPGFND